MAPSNLLVWNARGLNDKAHCDVVHQVVESVQPMVVCLQETKLAYISERDVLSILVQDFGSFVFLPAQGTQG